MGMPQLPTRLNTPSDISSLTFQLLVIIYSGANWKLVFLWNSYFILKVVSCKWEIVVKGLCSSCIYKRILVNLNTSVLLAFLNNQPKFKYLRIKVFDHASYTKHEGYWVPGTYTIKTSNSPAIMDPAL